MEESSDVLLVVTLGREGAKSPRDGKENKVAGSSIIDKYIVPLNFYQMFVNIFI